MDRKWCIVNVEAAIYREDKWLVIKRSEKEEHAPGAISFVGGKVEVTKASLNILEEALKREIMEEVGIEVYDDIQYIESKSFLTDKGEPVVDVVFLCRYKSGEPRCVSVDEVSGVFWLSAQEILEDVNTPIWVKQSLRIAEKMRLNQKN
ncbi:NUDIX hydrolase [Kosmotoga sp. DU53]|jgi:8-oxo-dGTP pyrophosphatase MutT (NUDIX family)|uniref:NUDIX hydrolase n=1 Tax=Kosmotoga sp. DU53 TaxID=1310160 RepID=UPI0007C49E43|nr:NUDIX domain-containing protein [Kosmotoga sp. DU53]MDK2954115.1 8-oxo-dGTP diphosphatase [Kosmotoga sp.]OAA23409.1 DNA mismatch repair protein MutT [Kosmotoga sp. DU53]